ncbi:hypothetical protein AB0M28_13470 [Streptomyces sp. NPDC051940]|uniref:hypothetical protein n=1 Tax=Streptomyces sp. NPDC051940 TaxID=3155675 RepID=UPI003435F8A4
MPEDKGAQLRAHAVLSARDAAYGLRMNAWTLVGGIVQLVGLALAGVGVRATRLQYGPNRLGIVGTARRLWREVLAGLGRRQQRPHNVVVGSAAFAGGGLAFGATGIVGPSPTATLEETVAFLVRQSTETQKVTADLRQRIDDERGARETAEVQLKAAIADAASTARAELAESQAGGLRLETWGLLLAALGTVLGLIGGF